MLVLWSWQRESMKMVPMNWNKAERDLIDGTPGGGGRWNLLARMSQRESKKRPVSPLMCAKLDGWPSNQCFKLANGLYSQSQASVLVPKASESKSVSPLRAISQLALAHGSHGCEPLWFSELDVAHLSGGSLNSWVVQCGIQTLHSSGRNSGFWIPSCLWLPSLGWCLGQASPTYFDVNLYLFTQCWGVAQTVFRCFFFYRERYPTGSCRFSMLVGGG